MTIRSRNILRDQNPVRCEIFFRNLAAMGVRFNVDRAAGRVTATYADGVPVDEVTAVEIRARQWFLLEQTEGEEAHAPDANLEA